MFLTPVIPSLTNPLGKYWEQPTRDELNLTLSSAWMGIDAFEKLQHYQHSIPSGAYVGKMWKWQDHRGRWHLLWYGTHPHQNICSINKLRIQIEP